MKPVNLVWYHIPTDQLFTASGVDALFYALQPLKWCDLELLGEL